MIHLISLDYNPLMGNSGGSSRKELLLGGIAYLLGLNILKNLPIVCFKTIKESIGINDLTFSYGYSRKIVFVAQSKNLYSNNKDGSGKNLPANVKLYFLLMFHKKYFYE